MHDRQWWLAMSLLEVVVALPPLRNETITTVGKIVFKILSGCSNLEFLRQKWIQKFESKTR
jgi:hypothetical protein